MPSPFDAYQQPDVRFHHKRDGLSLVSRYAPDGSIEMDHSLRGAICGLDTKVGFHAATGKPAVVDGSVQTPLPEIAAIPGCFALEASIKAEIPTEMPAGCCRCEKGETEGGEHEECGDACCGCCLSSCFRPKEAGLRLIGSCAQGKGDMGVIVCPDGFTVKGEAQGCGVTIKGVFSQKRQQDKTTAPEPERDESEESRSSEEEQQPEAIPVITPPSPAKLRRDFSLAAKVERPVVVLGRSFVANLETPLLKYSPEGMPSVFKLLQDTKVGVTHTCGCCHALKASVVAAPVARKVKMAAEFKPTAATRVKAVTDLAIKRDAEQAFSGEAMWDITERWSIGMTGCLKARTCQPAKEGDEGKRSMKECMQAARKSVEHSSAMGFTYNGGKTTMRGMVTYTGDLGVQVEQAVTDSATVYLTSTRFKGESATGIGARIVC